MCAWPYDAVDTVPSSATATTCGLSEVRGPPGGGVKEGPRLVGEVRLRGIPRVGRRAGPRGGELQARRDDSDLPRDHQPQARALDHQGQGPGPGAGGHVADPS